MWTAHSLIGRLDQPISRTAARARGNMPIDSIAMDIETAEKKRETWSIMGVSLNSETCFVKPHPFCPPCPDPLKKFTPQPTSVGLACQPRVSTLGVGWKEQRPAAIITPRPVSPPNVRKPSHSSIVCRPSSIVYRLSSVVALPNPRHNPISDLLPVRLIPTQVHGQKFFLVQQPGDDDQD